jgi:hypothetical protein
LNHANANRVFEWSKISETPGYRERLMLARDYAVIQGDSTHLARLMGQASSPVASAQAHREQVAQRPTPVSRAERDGSYIGPVEIVSDAEILQEVNGRNIRHELARYMSGSGGWKLLQAGTIVRIDYKKGLWKVREPHQQTRIRQR